jgi:hypothetical protein
MTQFSFPQRTRFAVRGFSFTPYTRSAVRGFPRTPARASLLTVFFHIHHTLLGLQLSSWSDTRFTIGGFLLDPSHAFYYAVFLWKMHMLCIWRFFLVQQHTLMPWQFSFRTNTRFTASGSPHY